MRLHRLVCVIDDSLDVFNEPDPKVLLCGPDALGRKRRMILSSVLTSSRSSRNDVEATNP